jgi:hypothetical protein
MNIPDGRLFYKHVRSGIEAFEVDDAKNLPSRIHLVTSLVFSALSLIVAIQASTLAVQVTVMTAFMGFTIYALSLCWKYYEDSQRQAYLDFFNAASKRDFKRAIEICKEKILIPEYFEWLDNCVKKGGDNFYERFEEEKFIYKWGMASAFLNAYSPDPGNRTVFLQSFFTCYLGYQVASGRFENFHIECWKPFLSFDNIIKEELIEIANYVKKEKAMPPFIKKSLN